MGWIILLFVAAGFCIELSTEFFKVFLADLYDKVVMLMHSVVFLLLAMAFVSGAYNLIAQRHSDGAPMANIELGTYKVAHVYCAGDRVSVLIEKPEKDGNDHLYLCQFMEKDLKVDTPEGLNLQVRGKWLVVYNVPSAIEGVLRSSKVFKLIE